LAADRRTTANSIAGTTDFSISFTRFERIRSSISSSNRRDDKYRSLRAQLATTDTSHARLRQRRRRFRHP
jgi:hypothetical protein